jgi:SnoaL-like polyketide cyclase
MAGRLPPFTLEDFTLSPAKRAEITGGLSERQAFMAGQWMDLHVALNAGDWTGFDRYMNTEKMTYDNPNRPDLGTFAEWSTSPVALYTTFPPSLYRTLKVWGSGDNEICVLCHHHGKHTGGPYMGVEPTGNQLDVLWFSWIKFEGDKIVHIYSISDVLSMLIDLEVIAAPQPVDPYK